jgi:hypothetical protein
MNSALGRRVPQKFEGYLSLSSYKLYSGMANKVESKRSRERCTNQGGTILWSGEAPRNLIEGSPYRGAIGLLFSPIVRNTNCYVLCNEGLKDVITISLLDGIFAYPCMCLAIHYHVESRINGSPGS